MWRALRGRLALVGGAALVAALALVGAVVIAASGDDSRVADESRTNVVVVLTDDQDAASMRFMPRTRDLLGDAGVTFTDAIVTTPLCCPARATFLTGQYAHAHEVLTNSGPDGGWHALDSSETLAVWLDRAGYRTGWIGKTLNGYGRPNAREVPPGWDLWSAQLSPGMFDYRMNHNGRIVRYGDGASDYKTDVLADQAVEFIDGPSGSERPFFLVVAPSAPHTERGLPPHTPDPRPAPRHAGQLDDVRLPTPPSFDEADVSDKPADVRELPRLGAEEVAEIAAGYRARLESLLAVDDLVERVVTSLSHAGELDDTLVVFTSDNGYLHGEHRIPTDKRYVYEESIKVPLLMRGPGLPEGELHRGLVGNVDLAPTILEAAGAEAPAGHYLHGRSLLGLASDAGESDRRALLVEYFDDPAYPADPQPYAAVRTSRALYARHRDGSEELYDLRRDPHQLASRHADPSYRGLRARLRSVLGRLDDCADEACRTTARAP